MTVEADNVALLKNLYSAWSGEGGNPGEFLEYLADEVCWRSLSNGAPGMEFTNECNCKNGVMKYVEEVFDKWSMNYYRVKEFVAQGDRVVVISECSWTSKLTGKTVETPKVDLWRLKDGKIVDFFELYDTARAEQAGSA